MFGNILIWCCLIASFSVEVSTHNGKVPCSGNGISIKDSCICYDGWQGPLCQFCGGKVRLNTPTGIIHDGFGNYSTGNKCSWLIEAPNSTITLHIEEFTTECGWDHLYVFDGDSVNTPLVATFSGLMYKESYSIRWIPEVTVYSGAALLHFHSDDANNMSGFSVTYRLNSCPSTISILDCSGNGFCLNGSCICDKGWNGEACHLKNCPNDCGSAQGKGVCQPGKGCSCFGNSRGADCGQLMGNGYWETITTGNATPPGSASHSATVWGDSMYVIGGLRNPLDTMAVFNFSGSFWETLHISNGPSGRYGHTSVTYGDKIYLYGGTLDDGSISSDLWTFDIPTRTWENITSKIKSCNSTVQMCGPLMSTGHSATVLIDKNDKNLNKMIIIFGYSPYFGYLTTVQEYYFETKKWQIIQPMNHHVKGSYGHSASWDDLTEKIYVYGGIAAENGSQEETNEKLYSYEPNNRIWTLLADAPSARFLHTSSFVSEGFMLVFGGTILSTTTNNTGKCYSHEVLAYDVLCNSWSVFNMPEYLQANLARFGHTALKFEDSLFIYGGFDGQMLNDLIKFTPGDCHFDSLSTCLSIKTGVKCVWDSKNSSCSPARKTKRSSNTISCLNKHGIDTRASTESISIPAISKSSQHKTPCFQHNLCTNCTQNECIWCYNEKRCIERNAYRTCFPYGQCWDYTSSGQEKCRIGRNGNQNCGYYESCADCKSDPACGWCDQGSGTGLGSCMSGGNAGPFAYNSCPSENWHFTTCPSCQCNGHAKCTEDDSSSCSPCANMTTGQHCQVCAKGFWGNPVNGGECIKCQCNEHTHECDNETGKCFCKTKGTKGNKCDMCDNANHYHYDVSKKSCFYELSPDYQYTFNLSRKTEKYYSRINFKSAPIRADTDVNFRIACSGMAKINVTIKSGDDSEEEILLVDYKCNSVDDHQAFRHPNITQSTFYANVYDFQTPFWIRVSFAQYPKLDLSQFLITLGTLSLI